MIVICGGIADAVTELVCARLEACKYAYRLLDLGRYPADFTVHWEWSRGRAEGTISGPNWQLGLSEITGVYSRYLGAEGRIAPAGVDPELGAGIHDEGDSGLLALFESLPCTVVNRCRGGMSNQSKPYQALLIQESGLRVPETLVTNDPAEAWAFFQETGGELIYKSLSGVRSIVRRVSHDHLSRLPLLRQGPAQFQRYVPGDNVRVHVVGERVFATRVQSEAVDYRYARHEGADCVMAEEALSPEIAEACIRLTRRLELEFSGIDLKITPDGEVFCFEVNPSPGFSFYELGTGQPISAALADLLHATPHSTVTAGTPPQHAEAHCVPGF